jgi:hypothetical protein
MRGYDESRWHIRMRGTVRLSRNPIFIDQAICGSASKSLGVYSAMTLEIVKIGSSIAIATEPISAPMKPIITGSMN